MNQKWRKVEHRVPEGYPGKKVAKAFSVPGQEAPAKSLEAFLNSVITWGFFFPSNVYLLESDTEKQKIFHPLSPLPKRSQG